ncbi:DUF1178 family protein [Alkalicaulis satelles]|uniref:DUF1178 family protein n=1 Tax=Alkalicaulis satelles TaxID=2609175 RepID=A0A5M6ZH88_9PROT|nr:DUF1178 family protein [Alkalicaulis satelles]KAA5803680.1 DUF1178 family protein [Alkalicaulis satelles]
MIRYALVCDADHGFEAWFSSSGAYDDQAARGLVECPVCGSTAVRKQVMAPAVRTSRSREARPAVSSEAATPSVNQGPDFETLARKVQAHIRSHYDYVGDDFARQARAIHAGETPERLIYGETSPAEREQLAEEGVPCAPLPAAFAPVPAKKAN